MFICEISIIIIIIIIILIYHKLRSVGPIQQKIKFPLSNVLTVLTNRSKPALQY